ncbi:MAG TPA: hypothetical protein VFK89_10545 [Actinomycetota bacterium]|nr:hypothetical protein [Actinomycetota bacterium]
MAEDTPRIDEEIRRTWREGEEAGTTAVGLADPDTTDGDGDGTDSSDGDTSDGDSSDADGTDTTA